MSLPGSEKRASARKEADLRSVILIAPVMVGELKNYLGHAKNISRTGMLIHTFIAVEEGTQFSLEFKLPRTETAIRCTARVVWTRGISRGAEMIWRCGVSFIDIEPGMQESIDGWVSQNGG